MHIVRHGIFFNLMIYSWIKETLLLLLFDQILGILNTSYMNKLAKICMQAICFLRFFCITKWNARSTLENMVDAQSRSNALYWELFMYMVICLFTYKTFFTYGTFPTCWHILSELPRRIITVSLFQLLHGKKKI